MALNISNGQKFISGTNLRIASDQTSLSKLEFYLDGQLVKTVTQAPWEHTIEDIQENPRDTRALIHYRFNEGSGQAALDSSGNHNHGQIFMPEDVAWTTGQLGQGIKLGGDATTSSSRGYINIPTNEKLQEVETSFTLAVWLKGDPSLSHTIFSNIEEGDNGIDIMTINPSGRIECYLNPEEHGNTYRLRTSSLSEVALNASVWRHYCWVYDGLELTVYVDGVKDTSIPAEGLNIKNTTDWKINTFPSLGSRGRLQYDDFRFYNEALSPSEIVEIIEVTESNGAHQIQVVANDGAQTDTVNIEIRDSFDRTNGFPQVLLNAGASTNAVLEDKEFIADSGFGYYLSPSTAASAVAGQTGIYATQRTGAEVIYTIPVPNGAYNVELHHIDSVSSAIGQRVFSVELNGKVVENNVDLFLINNNNPVKRTYEAVAVYDNTLTVKLTGVTGQVTVSAIDVTFLSFEVPVLPTLEVSLTLPVNNDTFMEGDTVVISATTPENVSEVEIFRNGKPFRTLTTRPFQYVWNNATSERDEDAVLHLRLDGNLVDYSPAKQDGIFQNNQNAIWIPGRKGTQAISLGNSGGGSATRSFILVPTSPILQEVTGGAFSIMYWFRGDPDTNHNIFSVADIEGPGIHIVTLQGDGRTDIYINQNLTGNQYRLRSSPSTEGELIDLDIWKHFAWIYNGETLSCYVNGILSNQVTIGAVNWKNTGDWLINSNETGSRGEGDYDDFRVYGHAVTAAKVIEVMEDNPSDQVVFTARIQSFDNWGISDPVNITINKPNRPPILRIEYPFQGLEFEEGDLIPISFICGDPDGVIESVVIKANGQTLGTITTAPWEYIWLEVPRGNFNIRLEGYDNDDLVGLSAVKSIVVGLKDLTPKIIKKNQIADILVGALEDIEDDPNRPRFALDDISRQRQAAVELELEHIRVDRNIVRVPGLISERFEVDVFHPRPYISGESLTFRSELYTRYNRIANMREGWFSVSFYWPEGQIPDKDDETVYQWHVVPLYSTPFFSAAVRDGKLNWQVRWQESGFANTMQFNMGAHPIGAWDDYVFYIKLSDNGEGRLKLWRNRKLARTYHPYTGELWKVPTAWTSADAENFPLSHVATPDKGTLPTTVIENGVECSVVDWFGKTCYALPAVADINRKRGLYKHGWNYVNPNDPLGSGIETTNRVLYIGNTKFTNANSPDRNIFELLDPDGLPALEGIVYNNLTSPALITNPTNGSTITLGSTVPVTIHVPAEAADIDKIDLYINNVLVRSATVKDFTYSWTGFEEGNSELYTVVYYTDLGFIQSNKTVVTASQGIPEPISLKIIGINIDPTIPNFIQRVNADGGQHSLSVRNLKDEYHKYKDLDLDLLTIPSAIKQGKIYSLFPVNGSADFSVSRNATATYKDSDGFIKVAPAHVPRVEYDVATGKYKGLLVEDQRRNVLQNPLVNYSADGVTVSSGEPSPIHGLNSILVRPTEELSFKRFRLYSNGGTVGNYKYMKFIVKYAGARFIRFNRVTSSGTIDYMNGVIIDMVEKKVVEVLQNVLQVKITPLLNGWIEIDIESFMTGGWLPGFQFYNESTGEVVYIGNSDEGILFAGASLDQFDQPDEFSRSLILTSGISTVTKAADVVSLSGLKSAQVLGENEGTILYLKDNDFYMELYKDGRKRTFKNTTLVDDVASDVPQAYQLDRGNYTLIGAKKTAIPESDLEDLDFKLRGVNAD